MISTLANGMIVLMLAKFMFNDVPHALEYPEKRAELVDRYGSWAVGRAEAVCPRGNLSCVENEAMKLQAATLTRWR